MILLFLVSTHQYNLGSPFEDMPREREFAGLIGLVLVRFEDALQNDKKQRVDGTYLHVLEDRDPDDDNRYAVFGIASRYRDVIRHNRGSVIEVRVPISESVYNRGGAYEPLIQPGDLNSYFFIHNNRQKHAKSGWSETRIDYADFDYLNNYLNEYGEEAPIPSPDEEQYDRHIIRSYLGLLMMGETIPLHRREDRE